MKPQKHGHGIFVANREQIAADYKTMSAKDVALKHGCHLQTVLNIARQLGVPIHAPCRRIKKLHDPWAT